MRSDSRESVGGTYYHGITPIEEALQLVAKKGELSYSGADVSESSVHTIRYLYTAAVRG
jgi:hypothetical protein